MRWGLEPSTDALRLYNGSHDASAECCGAPSACPAWVRTKPHGSRHRGSHGTTHTGDDFAD